MKTRGEKINEMGFKKVIVCLLLFGVTVLLIQMLALNNLNAQNSSRLPWETEKDSWETEKDSLEKNNGEVRKFIIIWLFSGI